MARGGDLNGVPILSSHIMVYAPRKLFHAKNKKIRGHGIALPYTSGGIELISFTFINEDRELILTQDIMRLVRLGGGS